MVNKLELTENKRILIVDDQASIHDDFRKVLITDNNDDSELNDLEASLFASETKASYKLNFEITSAYQGNEAIIKVEESIKQDRPFALAFVDVRMPPGMDGIETIRAIWKIDPNIQVVICTAFSDYSWHETIETLGQTDKLLILKKPFDVIEVMQLTCALVAKWNLTRVARLNQEQLESMVKRRTEQLSEQAETLKQTVKQLKEAKIQLFQADKLASIGQLAAGLAHEINNPIGFVSCNLEALSQYLSDIRRLAILQKQFAQDQGDAEKLDQDIEAIQQLEQEIDVEFILEDIDDLMKDSLEGIERVARIVGDLTEFSHVNTSEMLPVNVNELIEKTLSVARHQIKNKAKVMQSLDDLPEIAANGGQLGQVILNLLINACQAIETDGVIQIRTKASDDFVYIEIEDNGAGIPEDCQHKIFDPFFTSKPVGEGTGLGLHIVHNIITRHEGSINFDSKPGKGTCFTITLPVSNTSLTTQTKIA